MSVKQIYTNLNKKAFWLCLGVSIILLIVSFVLPPSGSIDPSVMGGVGELFAFASLGTVIEAISKGADVSVSHGSTTVTVNTPDQQ
jgi:hypothetical protein